MKDEKYIEPRYVGMLELQLKEFNAIKSGKTPISIEIKNGIKSTCGNCNSDLSGYRKTYCGDCGYKINWEGVKGK